MTELNDETYSTDSKYNQYFESYPYPLSPFQKQAIQAIVDGNHALVCAPTGSGKTLPAEFAIKHFTAMGKRVIYCSPIKALSNQKMYDFSKKYGDEISFGLLTGDIKTNPGAQVLIMTTEILMNKLFLVAGSAVAGSLTFDIDIENDLGAVIFDEVHMINSPDRGHVWEKCIMMLPSQIQMVMLSATLDNPQKFANWVHGTGVKEVVLCQTHKRIVPLTHYTYLTSGEGLFKKMKDKDAEKQVRASLNRCIVIQDAGGKFCESTYKEIGAILRFQTDHNVFMKRKAVLNDLFAHLKTESMLPAIAFIFSRKLVEICAEELTVPLLDVDNDLNRDVPNSDAPSNPYFIRAQCDSILRRLPNWREYAGLPEYETLVRLLERGIGIHHSGMIPVLREIVEFMIAEKRIKVLFATESFAIGLDCPIKTAVFVNLKKHDGGETPRYLLAHEYTQMAGRAGRRGLDTIGNVIHCSNLFDLPPLTTYKEILSGTPQRLTSKFKIYYPMILNLLSRSPTASILDFVGFAEESMLQDEIATVYKGLEREIAGMRTKLAAKDEGFVNLRTPREKLVEYFEMEDRLVFAANKKRKEIEMAMRRLRDTFQNLEKDIVYYREYIRMTVALNERVKMLEGNSMYIHNIIVNLVDVLIENRVLQVHQDTTNQDTTNQDGTVRQDGTTLYKLTMPKGLIASRIAEIHPILLANACPILMKMDPVELAATFSLFTDVRVHEEIRIFAGFKNICDNVLLNHLICTFNEIKEELIMCENRHGVVMPDSGLDRHCYDIIDYVKMWCECEDEEQCREVIRCLEEEKGVSVGDFSKALLKISTVSRELMAMCEVGGDSMVEFAHKLSKIDGLVLKYVATNQSLYL